MDSFYNIHSILLHKVPIYLSANQSNPHPAVQTGPQALPCVHHSTKRKERQFYHHYRSFLKSGKINNRLLCEIATHEGFQRLMVDTEICVDRIAAMRVHDMNIVL
ncbi:MAG: hypothetical protein IKE94_03865, partial [Aeriscardovia sp.]|nr:hypothetical protein [Aeriscardovia sp.]